MPDDATVPPPDDAPPSAPPATGAKAVLWTNPITLLGLLFVACGLVLLITFWAFHFLYGHGAENQYVNIIGFMILPGVLVNGLIMCPAGILLRRRRVRRQRPYWKISTRASLIFLAVTFFLILPVLGIAGYQGYHYTESAQFCGTVCHNMDPQYVRYQQSPHARVTCAGCHIGPGATPFVKSKLSGVRQVFKTALNTYPRPVPPAIAELRPARDTCEQCHWPSQFFGSSLKKVPHYAPDEANSLNTYEILIKVGGLNNHQGHAEGIHMHMLDRVEYIATDHNLEKIPWVRYKNPDGSTTIFRSDGRAASDPPPDGHVRKLDCIDCHNLIGHEFISPERSVDHALSVGKLDASLPFIKREAVKALSQTYPTTEHATAAIDKTLRTFYGASYPAVVSSRAASLDAAVATVQEIYRTNVFPDMNVNWKTYPSHIGHMESPGCFRCHDGLHVADTGKRITSDCNSCHTFLYRDPDEPGRIKERTFDHPMKINDAWDGLGPHRNMLCSDCHDGGLGAIGWREKTQALACGDCHPSGRWLQMKNSFLAHDAVRLDLGRPQPTATRPAAQDRSRP